MSPISHSTCVRPIVSISPYGMGYHGTCFVVKMFEFTFAVTARHCLGATEIDIASIRVPRNPGAARDTLMAPIGHFWYNSGDHDHMSDVAILILGEQAPGSVDVLGSSPLSDITGEDSLLIRGFPAGLSEIEHDVRIVDHDGGTIYRREGGVPRHDRARWVAHEFNANRTDSATSFSKLPEISFAPQAQDTNGMSGSPVLATSPSGETRIGGMYVRGNGAAGQGQVIPGTLICSHLFRVAMKHAPLRKKVLRWGQRAPEEHPMKTPWKIATFFEHAARLLGKPKHWYYAAPNPFRTLFTEHPDALSTLRELWTSTLSDASEFDESLASGMTAVGTPYLPDGMTPLEEAQATRRKARNRRKAQGLRR